MPDAPKTHTLNLTRGAAHLLSQLGGQPGLITEPAILFRFAQFAEDNLSDLSEAPRQPLVANPQQPTEDDLVALRAFSDTHKAWADEPLVVEGVKENAREALKSAVRAAITKGFLPSAKHSMVLLRELGLAPEDG
jgi:hypothetical protein